MTFSKYLQRSDLAAPINYEWTREISTGLQANPADDHPKLYDTLQLISVRAAFSLGVACSEWVVTRLQNFADVSDAVQRIQAAWAATIDFRYADLPKPEVLLTDAPDPIGGPLWLTRHILANDHQFLVKTYQGVKNKGVRGSALRLALLAQQVAGKPSGFEEWLALSLRKAASQYPGEEIPVQQEESVPPDFFDPDFIWSEGAVQVSQEHLVSELNPSQNPFLRKPDQMRADGFEGDPYARF